MNKKGFTLVELIIYIALSIILFFGLFSFIISINKTRERAYVISEVENQGVFMMNKIISNIKSTSNINTPTLANSGNSLSILLKNGTNVVFDLDNNQLQMKIDSDPEITLHNDSVIVNNLTFYNLTKASTKGNIKVQFIIKYNTNNTDPIYNYEKTFYGTANLQ